MNLAPKEGPLKKRKDRRRRQEKKREREEEEREREERREKRAERVALLLPVPCPGRRRNGLIHKTLETTRRRVDKERKGKRARERRERRDETRDERAGAGCRVQQPQTVDGRRDHWTTGPHPP